MKRNQPEFDSFVGDVVQGLLRLAYLIAWDAAEAEDLVQECLLRVARRWPRVRRMEHREAYVRRVVVNLALDESRRRARRRAELGASRWGRGTMDRLDASGGFDAFEDASAVRVLGQVEQNTDLVRALGALPPRQRAVLVLRYFDDLSEAQTADVMGCSVGTVKSTTSRALERLRERGPGEGLHAPEQEPVHDSERVHDNGQGHNTESDGCVAGSHERSVGR